MKRKIGNFLILSLVVGMLAAAFYQEDLAGQLSYVAGQMLAEQEEFVVVIDPGHGGMDGGAQARDGTSEKDINLAISKGLKRRLQADGIKTVLTRNGDEGLYEKNAKGAIRTLKTQDMKRRKQIIEASGADLAVSIHLNSFTQDPSVCGAQVFYPSEGDPEVVAESKAAAKILQDGFNEDINTRKARGEMGKNDVFLLRCPSSPVIIAECGFLSNPEDLHNLKKRGYQEQIVKILHKSIRSYLQQKSLSKAQ